MRSYVPSQVVEMLDLRLPAAKGECEGRQQHFAVNQSQGSLTALLVRMIDNIPEHLLALRGNDAVEFAEAVEAIRIFVARLQVENTVALRVSQGLTLHPVSIVRKHLAKLPDEAAGDAVDRLPFVVDQELRESLARDLKAVEDAVDRGAWKAATVLGGSVIEGLLLDALLCKEADALATAASLHSPEKRALEKWDLVDYICVAGKLGLIEESTVSECQTARGYRNLIHPGRERFKQPCDRGTALMTLAAIDHVVRDLRST